MKQFTDFRIFKKVVRKYWKKHAVKSYFEYDNKKYVSYWTGDVWCYYLLRNAEELNELSKRDWFKYDISPDALEEYLNEIKQYIGKDVCLYLDSSYLNSVDTEYEINNNNEDKPISDNIINCKLIGFALVNNGVLYAIEKDSETLLYPLNWKVKTQTI